MTFNILQGASNRASQLKELLTEIDYGMKILRYEEITLEVEDDFVPVLAYTNENKIVVFYQRDDLLVDIKISLINRNFRTKMFRGVSLGDIAVILTMVENTL